MATTSCPGRSARESPNVTGTRSLAVMRSTAMSVSGSCPTMSALRIAPVAGRADLHARTALHDVTVRQNQAVVGEDEAGSGGG